MDNGPGAEGGGGESCVVWVGSNKEGGGSCKQPTAKRMKTEEEAEKLEEILSRVERVVSPLRQYWVDPGDEACLVAWVTIPTVLECQQISSGWWTDWNPSLGNLDLSLGNLEPSLGKCGTLTAGFVCRCAEWWVSGELEEERWEVWRCEE